MIVIINLLINNYVRLNRVDSMLLQCNWISHNSSYTHLDVTKHFELPD